MIRRFAMLPLLLLACQQEKPGHAVVDLRHNRDGRGTPVATFGNDSLTAEELTQRFAEMSPYARARYQTVEEKKEYVDGMARFELLAAEAARRGLANHPEVVEQTKKMMVQVLLKKELEERPLPVPDTAVTEYYQKRKSDYVKPQMIRLSHVFFAAAQGSPRREEGRKKAQEALAQARALQPLDYQGFTKLVREFSEETRTKPLDGDMRYLSEEELAKEYGAPVAEAAKKLTQTGQVHDEVVETDAGFHVLKLQGRQAALNLTLDQVKPQIQNILIHEQKMAAYQKLLDGLKTSQAYEVHEEALGKVTLDLKAPALEPKGPTPGFAPPPTAAARP
ncbi:MAG: peptidylprolyl isomerase [Myxococcota bacterium]